MSPKRRRPPRNTHAMSRVATRGAGGLSSKELEERVAKRKGVTFLFRQTVQRSLARVDGPEGPAWCIINRKRNEIVTVLTEEQAAEQLRSVGRKLAGSPLKETAPEEKL